MSPEASYVLESLARGETALEMLLANEGHEKTYLFGLTEHERRAVRLAWRRVRRWKAAIVEEINEARARAVRRASGRTED